MLRRPFEFTLASLVGMVNQVRRPPLPEGQVKRLQYELGAQMGLPRPADDSAAESVAYHRQVEKPGPSRDIGDIGYPPSIGRRGDEVAFDQTGRRGCGAFAHGSG